MSIEIHVVLKGGTLAEVFAEAENFLAGEEATPPAEGQAPAPARPRSPGRPRRAPANTSPAAAAAPVTPPPAAGSPLLGGTPAAPPTNLLGNTAPAAPPAATGAVAKLEDVLPLLTSYCQNPAVGMAGGLALVGKFPANDGSGPAQKVSQLSPEHLGVLLGELQRWKASQGAPAGGLLS